MARPLAARLRRLAAAVPHPAQAALATVLAGRSGVATSGFPYIAAKNFQLFLDQVPHLFKDGTRLLAWLARVEKLTNSAQNLGPSDLVGISRAATVMRTVATTAAVCAPPDLWLLRHVLGAHRQLGVLAWLAAGHQIDGARFAEAHGLDAGLLRFELHFLRSRGYLELRRGLFRLAAHPRAQEVIGGATVVPTAYAGDLTGTIKDAWLGDRAAAARVALLYDAPLPRRAAAPPRHGQHWLAGLADIETGFRLVPLVLALRALNVTERLAEGVAIADVFPEGSATLALRRCLGQAGLTTATGRVTPLGARVFARGPGPFGIIHAYHPYMTALAALHTGGSGRTWVARGANVAASQDANRKTFQLANASLDRFCADTGFRYHVFLEHAVGRGEATRQRFAASGENDIRYFGADLEDAAIDKAVEAQQAGQLPRNMAFVRGADIGNPSAVLAALARAGVDPAGSVMLVGNGFHEIREQTNDYMISVFRGYQTAGIVLIFTEESALSDEDLLATGWNTYHAGFRYVHELSGQGLRPALDHGEPTDRYSWRTCAEQAGYLVLKEYSTRTRTIYPVPRRGGENPAISVNYFCVPKALGQRLGLRADAKT